MLETDITGLGAGSLPHTAETKDLTYQDVLDKLHAVAVGKAHVRKSYTTVFNAWLKFTGATRSDPPVLIGPVVDASLEAFYSQCAAPHIRSARRNWFPKMQDYYRHMVGLCPLFSTEASYITPVVGDNPQFLVRTDVTYLEVLETQLASISDANSRSDAQKSYGWVLSFWLEYTGHKMEMPATSFGQDFKEQRALFLESREIRSKADISRRIVASRLNNLQQTFNVLAYSSQLPSDFHGAIKVALERVGKTAQDLRIEFGEAAYGWASGRTTPKRTHSIETLRRLEFYLGLPENTLVVRSHRQPTRIEGLEPSEQSVAWRRYNGFIQKHEYTLPFERMPVELTDAIRDFIEHKKTREFLLPSGKPVVLPLKDVWNTVGTQKTRLTQLRAFFGFLALPTLPARAVKTWEALATHGLGIPVEDLRFGMLVNNKYLFAYMQFCKVRTFDEAAFNRVYANPDAPLETSDKSLPQTFNAFMIMVNNLVNQPYSFLRLTPKYAFEVGATEDKLEDWLTERHTQTKALSSAASELIVVGKRSNKETLQTMLRMENPLELVVEMVDRMRKELPSSTSPMQQAVHFRDMVIIEFLMFDPLRAINMSRMDIGKHIYQQKDGKWVLDIRRWEFKNKNFNHAEDKFRVLPNDLGDLIATWIKDYRPKLKGHDTTDALFIRAKTGPLNPKTDLSLERELEKTYGFEEFSEDGLEVVSDPNDIWRMKRTTLYRAIANHTTEYFGFSFGAHAFRTLVSTAVAKVGTPSQVKAVLNDSQRVAMDIYTDVRNSDENKALDNIYQSLRGPRHG